MNISSRLSGFCVALLALSAPGAAAPVMTDTALVVEPVATVTAVIATASVLTGIAFIGPNDMLLNSKVTGQVFRVTNGVTKGAVLDLPVNPDTERGLLDIALDPSFASNKLVYLYYTRANADGEAALSNRVSRFTWTGTALTNEQVLIDLPVSSARIHNGGILKFGPPNAAPADQKLFIAMGDLNQDGQAQNYFPPGPPPDYCGQIIRINPDGSVPVGDEKGPFYDVAGNNASLQVMYAYGIRNSYGIDFDPVTNKLWETENGPAFNDEINLVEPAFNSGWETLMGKATTTPTLVQFSGVGTYSDPEFVWQKTVAPTAIHFLRGYGLGSRYFNGCLVADSNNGKLYHFKMNATRTAFDLTGDLADGVLNFGESDDQVVIGQGFVGILNMTTGPDGNLYVVTYNTVYRVRSAHTSAADWALYL